MSIEVTQLTKQYETGQRAVDQISFSLKAGEIVGFLGPNGAGKSTTMKILTGYLPATEGTVMVEGFDVSKSPMEVRQHIGYLPEHNPLYLDLYVKEFLRFSGRLHGLNGGKLTQRVSDMIDLVGLTREQGKKISQLSKGYRQRVGLAQALLHDPAVLVLDEPTTGLDPNQLADIRNVIKQAGRNKTVLFSTHIMQEVEALCDRVIIINRGKIVADGALSQLGSSAADKAVVVAEFEQDLADPQVLASLTGIEQVEALGNGHYRITAIAGTDLRAAVFRLAADRGLTLVGLRQEASSLEGIFRNLTQE